MQQEKAAGQTPARTPKFAHQCGRMAAFINEQLRVHVDASNETPAIKQELYKWQRGGLQLTYKTIKLISKCQDQLLVNFILKTLPVRDVVYTILQKKYGDSVSVGTDKIIYLLAFADHSVRSVAIVMGDQPLPKCARVIKIGLIMSICGTLVKHTLTPHMKLNKICSLFTHQQISTAVAQPVGARIAHIHNLLVGDKISSIYCPDVERLVVVITANVKFICTCSDGVFSIHKIHGASIYANDVCVCWETAYHVLKRYWQLAQINASIEAGYEPPSITSGSPTTETRIFNVSLISSRDNTRATTRATTTR